MPAPFSLRSLLNYVTACIADRSEGFYRGIYIYIYIYTNIYSIRFASPGGPEKLLWSPGTLDEFRKWHAQMCLRWGPQGRENSVAFDVDCIILEVFFVVLAPFWCCFVASEAPGCMKKLF